MGVNATTRLGLSLLAVWAFAPAAPASGISKLIKKNKGTSKSDFADFQGKAHLRIPSGFSYFTGDDMIAFNKDTENVAEPGEVGLFVPEGGEWFVTLLVPPNDPLGGVAKEDVGDKSDQLLAHVRAKMDAINKDRTAAGLTSLRVTGWTHKPTYDRSERRVTWGFRITDDTEDEESDTLNFETFLFGPDGEVVELLLVSDVKGYSQPMAEYKKLVNAVVFGAPPGNWPTLSGILENERALFAGAAVLAAVGGGGLLLRRSSPEKRRATPVPRPW